jgi:hypothetical protein
MAQRKKIRGPTGIADPRRPEAFDPTLVAAAIKTALTLGKDSFTVGKDIYKLVKTEAPLLFDILESKAQNSKHEVRFEVSNTTRHGIYIESIVVEYPGQANTLSILPDQVKVKSGEPSYGIPIGKSEFSFPMSLPPGHNPVSLVITFPMLDWGMMEKHQYAIARVTYSKLDEKAQEEVTFRFRLRWQIAAT